MIRDRWRVGLVGFGRMAEGYSADPNMARYYPFATHAQVLSAHPRLDWRFVVDPDLRALETARARWSVPATAQSVSVLDKAFSEIDLLVLATPPASRRGFIRSLPSLRAVLAEKPLGENVLSSKHFLAECEDQGVMIQVNFWRRADQTLRELAAWRLRELVGAPVAVSCVYGNGLKNNGAHMIDMARFFFGEIVGLKVLDHGDLLPDGPIPEDSNPNFVLRMSTGVLVNFAPLDFKDYRENGMIIWGSEGRLDIVNEGLVIRSFPRAGNRAMSGAREVSNDSPSDLTSTVGGALYCLYDNVVDALDRNEPSQLWSSGRSAMESVKCVDMILRSACSGWLTDHDYF